jgi:hypothetical protein
VQPLRPSLKLSKLLYEEKIKPIMELGFPDVPYAAATMGMCSEAPGLDDQISMDHMWGPRVTLFLSNEDNARYGEELIAGFKQGFPKTFKGLTATWKKPGVDIQNTSEEMVLCGLGGKQGVKRALAPFFAQHPTTFSGYGNPYQLWFRKPEIEGLGHKRYAVIIKGAGVRILLEQDLERLLAHLVGQGHLAEEDVEGLLDAYLEAYHADAKRVIDRYRRRLRKMEPETRERHSFNAWG